MSDTRDDDVLLEKLTGTVLRREIHHALDERVAQYKHILTAFGYGVACLVIVLIVVGVAQRDTLFRTIHNYVFNVDESVAAVLQDSIDDGVLIAALQNHLAISYTTSFWLGTEADDSKQEAIFFHTNRSQSADAYCSISHALLDSLPSGHNSDSVEVRALINGQPTMALDWTTDPKTYVNIPLKHLFNPAVGSGERREDSHDLTFVINDATHNHPGHRVNVRCIIKVFGSDERDSP